MEKDIYLQKLIAFRSTTDNRTANNQVLDYIIDFLRTSGLHIAEYEFNGFRSFVATTIKDSKTPKVMLIAHVDVLPGPDSLFTLREDDKNYYGRGVYDMKFAMAIYMHVIDQIKDNLAAYDIGIMVVTDEEIGGMNGVAKLIEAGYKPGACILPDGGQDWNLETLAKGNLQVKVTASGKNAHGARPWEGDNAINRLMDTLHDIQQLFDDQHFNTNSLNIGALHGGLTYNQVPDSAYALLDIRYLSLDDYRTIIKDIQTICAKHGCHYIEGLSGQPLVTDINHPLVKPFVENITKVTGITPSGTLSTGASDGRFFGAIGVQCILTHPYGGGQHADTEWISKEGYQQFVAVVRGYLDKVALIKA